MNLRRLLLLLTLATAFGAFAAPALAHGGDDDGEKRRDHPHENAGIQEPSSDAPKDDRFGSACERAERKLERLERRAHRIERRIERFEDLLFSGELDEDEAVEIEEKLDWLEERLDMILERIDYLEAKIAEHCTAPVEQKPAEPEKPAEEKPADEKPAEPTL